MNERIKELAAQAGYTKDMFGVGHWDMPECKKFAKLIVRDCVEQIIIRERTDGEWYQDDIFKHFGVKK